MTTYEKKLFLKTFFQRRIFNKSFTKEQSGGFILYIMRKEDSTYVTCIIMHINVFTQSLNSAQAPCKAECLTWQIKINKHEGICVDQYWRYKRTIFVILATQCNIYQTFIFYRTVPLSKLCYYLWNKQNLNDFLWSIYVN